MNQRQCRVPGRSGSSSRHVLDALGVACWPPLPGGGCYCRLVILRSLNFTKLFYLQFLKYNLIINGLWNPL